MDLLDVKSIPLELRGPMSELRWLPHRREGGHRVRAIMIDSSAGTGKSIGTGATLVRWCLDYPGSRFLVCRQTLKSLRNSWQTSFEEQVLPAYGLSPGKGSKQHRQEYTIGGSTIVLSGLDEPQKLYSTEWNGVLMVEGSEASEDSFERFFRSLRWPKGAPFHVMVVETNPDSPYHWLYQKFIQDPPPGFVRRRATFRDNPAYYRLDTDEWTPAGAEFRDNLLYGMSGVRFQRLYEGRWAAAEGQVFDCFDPNRDVVHAEVSRENDGYFYVYEPEREPVRLEWMAAGQDWGFKSPGVVSVWGFAADGTAYLVEEIYQTERDDAWWTDEIERLHDYYGFWRVVSDPENAAGIAMANRRLRARDGRPLLTFADKHSSKAGKRKFAMVMHAYHLMQTGKIRFLADARKHDADSNLRKKPARTVEEIPGYQWAPARVSKMYEAVGGEGPAVDIPIKVNDHGIDAMLYLLWAVFEKHVSPPNMEIYEPRRPEHVLTRDPEYLRLLRLREQ